MSTAQQIVSGSAAQIIELARQSADSFAENSAALAHSVAKQSSEAASAEASSIVMLAHGAISSAAERLFAAVNSTEQNTTTAAAAAAAGQPVEPAKLSIPADVAAFELVRSVLQISLAVAILLYIVGTVRSVRRRAREGVRVSAPIDAHLQERLVSRAHQRHRRVNSDTAAESSDEGSD